MTVAPVHRRAAVALALLLLAATWPAEVTLAASTQAPPASLDASLEQAEALLARSDFAAAAPSFEAAVVAARELGLDQPLARALLGLGDARLRLREIAPASEAATESLEIYERLSLQPGIARTSLLLSSIEASAGHRDVAIAHAERAVRTFEALNDPAGGARAGMRLANLLNSLDPLRKGVLERTAAQGKLAGLPEFEGQALHRLGDQLYNEGLFEQSLTLLQQAAAVFEAGSLTEDLGTVYNSIGRLYRSHGRLDEALKSQKTALALHERGGSPLALLQSLNAVSTVYQRLGELATARSYLDRAFVLAQKSELPGVQDFLRANMASLMADMGELEPAARGLEQVIANGLDQYPAIRYVQLSDVYRAMGRGADALNAADEAVARCGDSHEACVSAYSVRSGAQALLGNLDAAQADLARQMSGLEDLRAQLVPSDFFKRDFHRYYHQAYTNAITLHMRAGQDRRALEVAETARSRAFLDLLASRAMPARSAPDLAGLPLPSSAPATRRVLTAEGAPASATDLAGSAARLRSTLLLYWVGIDDLFIWVIEPGGGLHARRVSVSRSRLASLVHATSPFVEDAAPAMNAKAPTLATRGAATMALRRPTSAWRDLHALVIEPIRDLLPSAPGALLTIVPHDVLTGLSFAALQNNRGRYLLEDFTLHYVPAGGLFAFTSPLQQPDSRKGDMLLVSDPKPPQASSLDTPLPRLPGARSEARAIARLLPAPQVTALQDLAATETRVRASLPDAPILHFATHAVVQDSDPFSSYLALTPSSADPAGDGVLTAEDVYGLRLHADLVVLSACRSASGTSGGDGIATFARAFLYAGTASFVASVWDVADEPTNRLLPAFYRAWLGGASKATALRRAQLALLADLRAGRVTVTTPLGPVPVPERPVFWAGFVLFGEPR